MKYIGGILYFDTEDMKSIGVSKKSLVNAKIRGSKAYTIINDPDDMRRILVEYASLRPALKDEAHQWLKEDPHNWCFKQWIEQRVTPCNDVWEQIRGFRINGNTMPEDDIRQYYTAAIWLKMIAEVHADKSILKEQGCSTKKFWQRVCTMIKNKDISLPGSYNRLLQKVREYQDEGAVVVIKAGNYENGNSVVINDEIADWLVAQYSLPTKYNAEELLQLYADEREKNDWPVIKDSDSIHKFLHRKDIRQHWYGARHGYEIAKEKYGYTLRTKLPVMRDVLWYSDGTKMNFFDAEGKLRAGWTVYEVVDVYSEAFLGYHIAKSENHLTQYMAYKMAFTVSGHRPYEIRTDNQGGHKKIAGFLDKLAQYNIRTQAYNGKSKTIESIFGRFQKKVMKRKWFFTGQNITAKSIDSKANMEFILSNVKNLPTHEQVCQIYKECRDTWNNSKHPKYDKTRMECYLSSHNPKTESVDYLDMVELFWLQTEGNTYYNTGISFQSGKVTYEYEVLKDGMPDEEFMRKNIDRKFIIKYDPDNMDHIRLYSKTDKGLQFITIAEPRLVVPRALQDHQQGDMAKIQSLLEVRKRQVEWMKTQTEERENRTGISRKKLLNQYSLGSYQKDVSYMDVADEDIDITPEKPKRKTVFERI